MANDPNRLAWKGTPGPWQVSRFIMQEKYKKMPPQWIDENNQTEALTLRGAGKIGSGECNQIAIFRSKEDLHMASAAPEAVEFIADLLEWIENTDFEQDEVKQKIARAEDILKKAYNF